MTSASNAAAFFNPSVFNGPASNPIIWMGIFSGRWARSRPLNGVDGQSTWFYLSLTPSPAFAKNREGTTDTCSGVCSADLLSAKNKLTDVARRAQIFSDPIFPLANSKSQNHRTSGGL